MSRFPSDIGPFAVIPLRLIEQRVSDRAVRVFALLAAKYADREGRSFPSRSRIAEDLDISVDTVDRALAELEKAGALAKERRKKAGGDFTSSEYVLRYLFPEGATDGSRKFAATGTDAAGVAAEARRGSRTDAATVAAGLRHQEPDPVEPDPVNKKDSGAAEAASDILWRRFLRFWEEYPIAARKGREAAWEVWKKLKPSEALTVEIIESVRRHIEHDKHWRPNRNNETFIPNPRTYLRQKRWTDGVVEGRAPGRAPMRIVRDESASDEEIAAVLADAVLSKQIEQELEAQTESFRARMTAAEFDAMKARGRRMIATKYAVRERERRMARGEGD